MSTHVDSSLDYSAKVVANGIYRYSKVHPNNGTDSFDGQSNAVSNVVFDIPAAKVYNFSKSYLEMSILIAEPGNTTSSHRFHAGTHTPIERITLQTRSGVYLCDVPNVAILGKVALPIETSFTKYKTLPAVPYIAAVDFGATTLHNHSTLFAPSHSLSYEAPNYQTHNIQGVNTDEKTFPNDIDYDGTCKQLNGGVNDPIAFKYYLDFDLLKGTIMSLNKDMYYGDVLQLTVSFAQGKKMFYTFSSNGGAGGFSVNQESTLIYRVSNLKVQMATEVDPDILAQLMHKVDSGSLNMTIPYIHSFKNSINAAGSFAASMRLSRIHGKSVVRIYSSVFNSQESSANSLNNTNYSSSQLVSFFTSLNYQRLQDGEFVCASNEDYLKYRTLLDGSTVMSADQYKARGNAIIESFKGGPLWSHDDEESGGLSLDTEQVYGVDVVVPAACHLYTFVVCQKVLSISRNAILVV